ncbi:MAG: P1 family peptidase [Azospirillaceae bacterium]|nr:P1 family peptidase [Azospirillaceae bacterium]
MAVRQDKRHIMGTVKGRRGRLLRAVAATGLMMAPLLGHAQTADKPAPAATNQDALTPVLNSGDTLLRFDWPMVRIGTGEYDEGPTGVTVFSFGRKVLGAVDVRGGGPGTVNTDYLRLGYSTPDLDSVVFAGGSWYGLEATTAVATAMMDEGRRGGAWDNIALSVGAIIYDLGDRRLNEVYPDKRLAQAAYHAVRPGTFPLGAHGAGRMARTGGLFGCNAPSGQGGAFRQIGDVKIAVFTVVNALGVVTDRDGRIAACYLDKAWPKGVKVDDLMRGLPDSRKPGWAGPAGTADTRHNTTVSLVITNQKMEPAELQRLAVQVHTSMARGLQPFSTIFDGDVLYAVSTGELEADKGLPSFDLATAAGEVMWDAILASVPTQPTAPKALGKEVLKPDALAALAGDYVFSPHVTVHVTAEGGKLYAQATGERPAYAITKDKVQEVLPVSDTDFTLPGRYPLTLRFAAPGTLLINPGPYQQTGRR